jgi:hypothetical protein
VKGEDKTKLGICLSVLCARGGLPSFFSLITIPAHPACALNGKACSLAYSDHDVQPAFQWICGFEELKYTSEMYTTIPDGGNRANIRVHHWVLVHFAAPLCTTTKMQLVATLLPPARPRALFSLSFRSTETVLHFFDLGSSCSGASY